MQKPKPTPLERRLMLWRNIYEPTGCWLWSLDKKNEYGRIGYKGKKHLAHRLSAIAFLGFDDSPSLQVNHKCSHKACFNPEHIYIGTAQDNSNDYHLSKTHCKNGHEFTTSNSYTVTLRHGPRKGQVIRNCRECSKLNARKYRRQ